MLAIEIAVVRKPKPLKPIAPWEVPDFAAPGHAPVLSNADLQKILRRAQLRHVLLRIEPAQWVTFLCCTLGGLLCLLVV